MLSRGAVESVSDLRAVNMAKILSFSVVQQETEFLNF